MSLEQRTLWRRMSDADLPMVNAIADEVHLDYPEDEAVFAERLQLYPLGCFVLEVKGNEAGYIISHPWHFKQPPALNSLLRSVPDSASTYYIHDIALLPAARKTGAASQIVDQLIEHARGRGLPNVSLVAVNHSIPFWRRRGFCVVEDASLDRKLRSYDDAARFMVRNLCSDPFGEADRGL